MNLENVLRVGYTIDELLEDSQNAREKTSKINGHRQEML